MAAGAPWSRGNPGRFAKPKSSWLDSGRFTRRSEAARRSHSDRRDHGSQLGIRGLTKRNCPRREVIVYDPTIGRWFSEDPIGFEGGDANLYRYVGNMPTMYVDPSGLEEQG